MRGSPLIRFIFLAIALVATGAGLARITAVREDPPALGPSIPAEISPLDSPLTPFHLLLSAEASELEIDTGRLIRPSLGGSEIAGTLQLDPRNPRVALVVRWKQPAAAGEHRFAKLRLELPGQPTFTHVFDARGDIDELLELPLPAAP